MVHGIPAFGPEALLVQLGVRPSSFHAWLLDLAPNLELFGHPDQLLGDRGVGAHREAVVLVDDLLDVVLRDAGLHVDIDAAIPKDLHGGGRQLVGDENAGFGHGIPREVVRS